MDFRGPSCDRLESEESYISVKWDVELRKTFEIVVM